MPRKKENPPTSNFRQRWPLLMGALTAASLMAAGSANAGLVTVAFGSVVEMDGAPVQASGEFIIDDEIFWQTGVVAEVFVGGQLDLGGEFYPLLPDSGLSFATTSQSGDQIALVADYGTQFFTIELAFDQSLVGDDPLASLLDLTFADLLPSSQFYFFNSSPFEQFIGPVTEFSVSSTTTAVSEPSIVALLGCGLVALWARRRRIA